MIISQFILVLLIYGTNEVLMRKNPIIKQKEMSKLIYRKISYKRYKLVVDVKATTQSHGGGDLNWNFHFHQTSYNFQTNLIERNRSLKSTWCSYVIPQQDPVTKWRPTWFKDGYLVVLTEARSTKSYVNRTASRTSQSETPHEPGATKSTPRATIIGNNLHLKIAILFRR